MSQRLRFTGFVIAAIAPIGFLIEALIFVHPREMAFLAAVPFWQISAILHALSMLFLLAAHRINALPGVARGQPRFRA